jgi:hypothetical protein
MADILNSTPRNVAEFLPKFRRRYMEETLGRNQFSSHIGPDDSNAIQTIVDNKEEGESIQFQFLRELEGTGVAGGMRQRGVEAVPKREKMTLKWEFQRNAVALKRSDEKKTIIELAPSIAPLMQKWSKRMLRYRIVDALRMVAPDKTFASPLYSIDAAKVLAGFPALVQPTTGVAPTSAETAAWLTNNRDRILFGINDASFASTANLSTNLGNVTGPTDGASLALIRKMHDMAKNANPFIEPLSWDDQDKTFYTAFVDTFSFRQLQAALQQINTDARPRESSAWESNPVFTGGDLIYDGIIIKEIVDLKPLVLDGGVWRDRKETDSAAVKDTAKGQIFMVGRQAVALGIAQEPKPIDDTDDYGMIKGMGIEEALGCNKFQREDYADATKKIDFGMLTAFTNANA